MCFSLSSSVTSQTTDIFVKHLHAIVQTDISYNMLYYANYVILTTHHYHDNKLHCHLIIINCYTLIGSHFLYGFIPTCILEGIYVMFIPIVGRLYFSPHTYRRVCIIDTWAGMLFFDANFIYISYVTYYFISKVFRIWAGMCQDEYTLLYL